MDKAKHLTEAQAAREEEVFHYQINIDNFTRAIAKVESMDDHDLSEFKETLQVRLKTEQIEQKKAKIILEVITDQLGELQ